MSKSKLPEPTNSEEVDLGQLFKIIGIGLNNLFSFIGKIFKGGYKVLLLLLIHFFKRKLWYAGAIVIGLIIGFIIDKTSEKEYAASIYIETNFDSARQVYEIIKQFHQLANQDKDTLELAKRLNISPLDASHLKGFYIDADRDANNLVSRYSNFYKQLDSVSRLDTSFEIYKSSLMPYSFPIHKIGIASTDKAIYKKIEEALITSISGNAYLNRLVEVNQSNLEKKDKVLLKEIRKTDSLLNEYLKIRINESKKELVPGSGTTLYMGNAETNDLIVDESTIIEKILNLESQRREVNMDRVIHKNIINVLSNFPENGYDISEWYDKMKFLLPLILFTLALLIFAIIGLGRYLNEESEHLY